MCASHDFFLFCAAGIVASLQVKYWVLSLFSRMLALGKTENEFVKHLDGFTCSYQFTYASRHGRVHAQPCNYST
jgi:hypothetical protein